VFGAAEALDKGLVTRVLPDDEVEAAAFATARRIAAGAPLVNRWHKRFIERVHASGRKAGGDFTAEEHAEGFACFGTADYRVSHALIRRVTPAWLLRSWQSLPHLL
jgi:enoyl-CoA hydratase